MASSVSVYFMIFGIIEPPKTIIYKIVYRDPSTYLCYVGHTKDFDRRWKKHKDNSYHDTTLVYRTIREKGGWEMFEMTVVDRQYCATYTDKFILEREWCDKLKANLNENRPYVYREEHLQEKRDYYHQPHVKAHTKEYRARPEQIQKEKERVAKRALDTVACECGVVIAKRDFAQHCKTQKHMAALGIPFEAKPRGRPKQQPTCSESDTPVCLECV